MEQFLPVLLRGEQRQGWAFGAKCAELTNDPRDLIEKCFTELRSANPDKQNPQLLRGILSNIKDRQLVVDILNQVAGDNKLLHLLVPLSTAIKLSLEDFDRVVSQITIKRLDPNAIRPFAYGSVSASFDDVQFAARLESIVKTMPSASASVLEIINMHCFNRPEKWVAYRLVLGQLLLSEQIIGAGPNSMIGHYWQENAKQLLLTDANNGWAAKLTMALIKRAVEDSLTPWLRDWTTEIVGILLDRFTATSWPLFCEAFKKFDDRYYYPLIELLTHGGSSFHDHGSPLWHLPEHQFKTWAEANPILAMEILRLMSLYVVTEGEKGAEKFAWHPHALMLMGVGDVGAVISSIYGNLSSFGSSGSRIPYIEKRLALAKELPTKQTERMARISDALLKNLAQLVERERKRDAHFAAGIVD